MPIVVSRPCGGRVNRIVALARRIPGYYDRISAIGVLKESLELRCVGVVSTRVWRMIMVSATIRRDCLREILRTRGVTAGWW